MISVVRPPRCRHVAFVDTRFLMDVNYYRRRLLELEASPPGVLHSVSANASPVNAARFLAIVVAEKGAPITVTL